MNKTRYLLLAVLIGNLFTPIVYAGRPTEYRYTLNYKFENRGSTDFLLTEEDISLPLFMNTTGSTVQVKEIDRNYRVNVIDSDGNRGAIIDMDLTLSPSEVEEFTAVYEIFSSGLEKLSFRTTEAEGFEAIPLDLVTEYNISTETFPTEDPVFYDLASSLVDEEDTVLEAVSTLVEYVMDETTYKNFETPQYPDDTLNNRLGDCDDQSILLITMLRSLGIPAYLQVGIFIHGSIDDTDSSWDDHLINNADGVAWHGWAMIYIPPWGWVPVDLTLTNAESGLELIKNSPEYESNIIPVLNVSKQDYIGGTVEARERFINSSVYVTVTDKAETIYGQDKPFQNYLLLGLGSALLITIGFMFRYGNPE